MGRAIMGRARAMADRPVGDPVDIQPAAPRVRPAAVPAELIENAGKGDERAFELLFAAYHGPLLRYLRTISPGIAGGIVIELKDS